MNAITLPIFSLTLLLVSATALPTQAQQAHRDSGSTANRSRLVFTVVEQRPDFPGGMNQLGAYLRKSLRDSEIVQNAKVKGRIFANFIVSEDGRIEDVNLLKGLDPALDAEVIRIIQNMPAWIPGKQNGIAVACRYNIPVNIPQ